MHCQILLFLVCLFLINFSLPEVYDKQRNQGWSSSKQYKMGLSFYLFLVMCFWITAGHSVILADVIKELTSIWTYFKQIFLTYATVYLRLICSFRLVSLNPHAEFPTCPYKPSTLLNPIHWDSSLPRCFKTSINGSRTAARKKEPPDFGVRQNQI